MKNNIHLNSILEDLDGLMKDHGHESVKSAIDAIYLSFLTGDEFCGLPHDQKVISVRLLDGLRQSVNKSFTD